MDAENIRHTRLQKLGGSDFEIVDGQPDIRGWDVKDAAGKQIGEVEELIFDYQSQKVRYLVVDLDDNEYDLDDREVLIPIGIAELHENDDDVILPTVTVDQLRALPDYDESRFDTEHETNVRNVFGGLGAATTAADIRREEDFYSHEHFNDARLYRNRLRRSTETGSVNEVRPADYDNEAARAESSGYRLRGRNRDTTAEDKINLASREDTDEYNDAKSRNMNKDFD
jgi:sporulation protein YlmC with PRC-barrel domain